MKYTALVLVSLLSACRACEAPPEVHVVDHGQFRGLHLVRAQTEPNGVVLLASDAPGWDARAQRAADALARAGALVVGIDTPGFLAKIERGSPACVQPAGDLDNLARFAQAYSKLPRYAPAVLVGLGVGAGLSVAAQLQVNDDTFAGVIGVDFCDALRLRVPLCSAGALALRSTPPLLRFAPRLPPAAPIITLTESKQPLCPGGLDPAYAGHIQHASLLAAYASLASRANERAVRSPPELADLPIVEVPAVPSTEARDVLALFVSGDGGWAGLDRELAARLTQRGISCVGLDSLRYFWTARTPDGLARDLTRILQFYRQKWRKSRVLLIGFSQGADVLPFAVNRLPAARRGEIEAIVALALSREASFEFHIANWVSADGDGLPTLPEVRKLAGRGLWCVYGDQDADALCPQLPSTGYHVLRLPGSHHFDDDYDALADIVLRAVDEPSPTPGPQSSDRDRADPGLRGETTSATE